MRDKRKGMNRCQWFLIFICGFLLSVVLLIITEIIKHKVLAYLKDGNKPFVLLDEPRMHLVDEDRLSLILRNPQELKPKLSNVEAESKYDRKG